MSEIITREGATAERELMGWRNSLRVIACRNCGADQPVGDAQRNGICRSCKSELCVYCGCTDEKGCNHPDFASGVYVCSWVEQGVCSFCDSKIVEELYLIATGRAETVKARYQVANIIVRNL